MLVTLRGHLSKDIFEYGETRIRYIPWRGFKYDYGDVFAQFFVTKGVYILITTVKDG